MHASMLAPAHHVRVRVPVPPLPLAATPLRLQHLAATRARVAVGACLLQYLRKLAPPTEPYLHNDLHLREAPADW
jgi:hypothetical protein